MYYFCGIFPLVICILCMFMPAKKTRPKTYSAGKNSGNGDANRPGAFCAVEPKMRGESNSFGETNMF